MPGDDSSSVTSSKATFYRIGGNSYIAIIDCCFYFLPTLSNKVRNLPNKLNLVHLVASKALYIIFIKFSGASSSNVTGYSGSYIESDGTEGDFSEQYTVTFNVSTPCL